MDHLTRARRALAGPGTPTGRAPAGVRVPLERRAAWALGVPTLAVLAAAAVVQVVVRLAGPNQGLITAFGLDGEHNVPAFWNTTLLLAIAGAALLVSVLTPAGRRPSAGTWRLAAAAATYLAADEALSVHEKLGIPVNALTERLGVDLPIYTWVIPGALIALAGAVVGVRVAAALPRGVRLGLIAGVLTYVTGALVVETVNGALLASGHGSLYALSTGVEELLEMSGCVVVACVLLRLVDLHPVTRTMTPSTAGPGATGPDGPGDPAP